MTRKPKQLRGFLINPWQRRITEVQVDHDIQAWHKLVHCDCLDVCHIARCAGKSIDIWLDDNGYLKNPCAPRFAVSGYPEPLCGYGLVLASTPHDGNTVSVPKCLSLEMFKQQQHLVYERWEDRIDPRTVDPDHIIP
jgi:hypothetical protein